MLEHGQRLLLVHHFNDFSGAREVTRPTGIIPGASSEFLPT
jgi:hypothetical protein